jgi:hypothetical protein
MIKHTISLPFDRPEKIFVTAFIFRLTLSLNGSSIHLGYYLVKGEAGNI